MHFLKSTLLIVEVHKKYTFTAIKHTSFSQGVTKLNSVACHL